MLQAPPVPESVSTAIEGGAFERKGGRLRGKGSYRRRRTVSTALAPPASWSFILGVSLPGLLPHLCAKRNQRVPDNSLMPGAASGGSGIADAFFASGPAAASPREAGSRLRA